MSNTATGWRKTPVMMVPNMAPHTDEKTALFDAARACGRALSLRPKCRMLLDQLCAVYGGELVAGRLLVWPSNEHLEIRTGIPERTIRFAMRELIALGVITARDSPNGKRYARRDRRGNIIDAYGFDLGPLLHRLSEWKDRIVAQEDARRAQRERHDRLVVMRRCAQEAINALLVRSVDIDAVRVGEIKDALQGLCERFPRRGGAISDDLLLGITSIREEAESLLIAANAGHSCRHKEAETNPLENLSVQGIEHACADFGPRDVIDACPSMTELTGPIRNDHELIAAGEQMKGYMGVSPSAWNEAVRTLGPSQAACLLLWVGQLLGGKTRVAQPIQNPGGYYRVLTRKMAEGSFNLQREIGRSH
jgi:replication initiation protein RepC